METIQKLSVFLSHDVARKLIWTLLVILITLVVSKLLLRIINKKVTEINSRYSWQKTVGYSLTFLAMLIIGRIWFMGFQNLSTFLGLLTAGIAIALKDLIASLAGWLYIIWRRPFEVGNRIQIGEIAGDVIDVRPFQFTLLEIGNWVDADQSTGRIIHIPNHLVFIQPVFNYDKGFKYIWNEIPVLITFESNWIKAKEILLRLANDNALPMTDEVALEIKNAIYQFMVVFHKVAPAVYTSVADSGVMLTMRYLVDIRNRRGSTEAIWEGILTEFAQNDDIHLAYKTTRILSEQIIKQEKS
jgi:small-conductance mechanosensitive channel